ncbi:hypothetical protein SUGI_1154210 [Cryptomeria japonica]|nr:hypothetical protein SUGI_1154210 [Cryptomeria japonica]
MAWCIGSVSATRQHVPAITIRHNLNFTLPRRGSACGRARARRPSPRKNTRDSASLIIPTTKDTDTVVEEEEDEEYVVPKLPGDERDFWEGPQWDTVGFVMQYLWAFGIVFAVVACGVAVRTYNFGAADFKETPVYKEAIESQGLFEEAPETPESQVFETNPTEIAPSP